MWLARKVNMSRPDPISLRFPVELREKIENAAKQAGRSLNAEVRMRIEASFAGGFDGQATDNMLANEVETLRSELRGATHNLNETVKGIQARLSALEGR